MPTQHQSEEAALMYAECALEVFPVLQLQYAGLAKNRRECAEMLVRDGVITAKTLEFVDPTFLNYFWDKFGVVVTIIVGFIVLLFIAPISMMAGVPDFGGGRGGGSSSSRGGGSSSSRRKYRLNYCYHRHITASGKSRSPNLSAEFVPAFKAKNSR